MSRFNQLPLGKIRKRPRLAHELCEASRLHDFAAREHDNTICIADGAEAMRNHNPRDAQSLQRGADDALGLVVERAGCLIKQKIRGERARARAINSRCR